MKTRNNIYRRWALLLILLIGLPSGMMAQTTQYEMVIEKTDGTELSFRIIDNYPLLQYHYGDEEDVNTLEIQTTENQYVPDRTHIPCQEIKRLFTRELSYVIGDVTGNSVVDVSDYIGVANHILGKTPAGFNALAADVNGDQVVDISDYIGVANIILTGSIYGKSGASSCPLVESEEPKHEPQ